MNKRLYIICLGTNLFAIFVLLLITEQKLKYKLYNITLWLLK